MATLVVWVAGRPRIFRNLFTLPANLSARLGVLFLYQILPAMDGRNLFNFGPALGYFFRKNDPNRKTNFNLRTMHFINKLSMAMFLVGLCVVLYRLFTR